MYGAVEGVFLSSGLATRRTEQTSLHPLYNAKMNMVRIYDRVPFHRDDIEDNIHMVCNILNKQQR